MAFVTIFCILRSLVLLAANAAYDDLSAPVSTQNDRQPQDSTRNLSPSMTESGAAQDAGQSSGNAGCLFILVVALFLFAGSQSFWGLLDDYRENPVVAFLIGGESAGTSSSAGQNTFVLPEGAVYIDFCDGVDYDTASEDEVFAGMDRAKEKLRQAFLDMETDIYLSTSILFNDTSVIPNDVFWIDVDEGRYRSGRGRAHVVRGRPSAGCGAQTRGLASSPDRRSTPRPSYRSWRAGGAKVVCSCRCADGD